MFRLALVQSSTALAVCSSALTAKMATQRLRGASVRLSVWGRCCGDAKPRFVGRGGHSLSVVFFSSGTVAEPGSMVCTGCTEGTSPNKERSACVACEAGKYALARATQCPDGAASLVNRICGFVSFQDEAGVPTPKSPWNANSRV